MTPAGGDGTPPAPARPLPLPAAAALVAAGGSVGVLVRALLAQGTAPAPGEWPATTFAINVAGSLALGALLAVLQRGPDVGRRRVVRLGVGTGVLGGFTTYSTFALEVEQLLTTGHAATGLAYALGSVVLGVAAAAVGALAAGRVLAARPAPDAGAGVP